MEKEDVFFEMVAVFQDGKFKIADAFTRMETVFGYMIGVQVVTRSLLQDDSVRLYRLPVDTKAMLEAEPYEECPRALSALHNARVRQFTPERLEN